MERERLFSIKRVLDLSSEEDIWIVLGLGCNHFFNVIDMIVYLPRGDDS